MYQFCVDFIGQVPEQFQFVYVILTLVLSILFFSVFTSLFYWILKLFEGVR
uniref:Uncharacterized protein n=1 Tax=Dulem virus 59 TaxID=3145770 RepID=A0AAU8B5R3_9VIRU